MLINYQFLGSVVISLETYLWPHSEHMFRSLLKCKQNKMIKSIAFCRSVRSLVAHNHKSLCPLSQRYTSSDTSSNDGSVTEDLLGQTTDNIAAKQKTLSFAEAFEKFKKLSEESKTPKKPIDPMDNEMFPTMLRYSSFIQMGDPIGKIVVGRIEDVIEEDLYIDFGNKFNAICKRPKVNSRSD